MYSVSKRFCKQELVCIVKNVFYKLLKNIRIKWEQPTKEVYSSVIIMTTKEEKSNWR